MKSFVHVHSSSRFDRSPLSLFNAAVRYNTMAELVTYTEVSPEKRENAIRKANNHAFGTVCGDKSPRNDCVISYKHSRFRLLHDEQFGATSKDFDKAGEDLYATIAVLYDRVCRRRVVVAVIHLPAHLEDDMRRGRGTTRTKAWYDAFDNLRRHCNHLKRKFRAAAVMLIADFNLNFKKSWVRRFFALHAPHYHHTWKNLRTRLGTHGRRIIDATLIKGRMMVKGSARVIVDDDSSDHRPYAETLVFT